jgi:hypothetical protein
VTFYWLDASVRVARRSDPLSREAFKWERLRVFLWAWILVVFSILTGTVIGGIASPTNNSPALALFLFFLSPIFLVAISGLRVLPRAAKFASDKKFGKHLLWFGLFLFFVLIPLLNIFIPMYGPPIPSLVPVLAFAIPQSIGGYCLYRSASSLASLKEPNVVLGSP